jgi:hypothetical protein
MRHAVMNVIDSEIAPLTALLNVAIVKATGAAEDGLQTSPSNDTLDP